MNVIHEKTPEFASELHYKTAYLHLFGAIASLAERIEAADSGISLADVRGSLEQALRDAEECACAD